MSEHYHFSIENILFTGIAAIIVIQTIRVTSAKLITAHNPMLQNIGKGLGGTVHFGN